MNPFPKCISTCPVSESCLRSKDSMVSAEVDYIRVYLDEDRCSWLIKVADIDVVSMEESEVLNESSGT